jgi:hypothetical protein
LPEPTTATRLTLRPAIVNPMSRPLPGRLPPPSNSWLR